NPGPLPPGAGDPVPGVAPPPTARSIEDFDTTTEAERQAAAEATGGTSLGATIASLGDPAAPGFWLETPLVDATRPGRVVVTNTGASAEVELRPIAGPVTGGSRISLAALRVLGLTLTDLPELEVYGS